MDMESFKVDFKTAMSRLPKEVLEAVPALVLKHLAVLEKVGPAILEDLKPHIGAIMAELPFGLLDKDELLKVVTEALDELGVAKLPAVKVA